MKLTLTNIKKLLGDMEEIGADLYVVENGLLYLYGIDPITELINDYFYEFDARIN